MPTLTVTSKGQITLRKKALRHLGLQAGDQVEYELLADNQIRLHPAKRTGTIDDLYGFLKGKGNGKTATIEEMNESIADGWAGIEG
jgi:AbrB family looped-hinge helix DNA binding protein